MSSRFADTIECMPHTHIANIGLIWIKLRVPVNGWVRFVADFLLSQINLSWFLLIFFVLKVTAAAYVTIRERIAVTSVKKLATFFSPCRNSVLLLLTVWAAGPCLRQHIAPIFWKRDNPHNISFTGEARTWLLFTYGQCFERLHIPTYLGSSWKWSCHIFTYHRGPLVEWFAALNSV